jgi:hypothetical protein
MSGTDDRRAIADNISRSTPVAPPRIARAEMMMAPLRCDRGRAPRRSTQAAPSRAPEARRSVMLPAVTTSIPALGFQHHRAQQDASHTARTITDACAQSLRRSSLITQRGRIMRVPGIARRRPMLHFFSARGVLSVERLPPLRLKAPSRPASAPVHYDSVRPVPAPRYEL